MQKVTPWAILYRKSLYPFCHSNMDPLAHIEEKELQISGCNIYCEDLMGK